MGRLCVSLIASLNETAARHAMPESGVLAGRSSSLFLRLLTDGRLHVLQNLRRRTGPSRRSVRELTNWRHFPCPGNTWSTSCSLLGSTPFLVLRWLKDRPNPLRKVPRGKAHKTSVESEPLSKSLAAQNSPIVNPQRK